MRLPPALVQRKKTVTVRKTPKVRTPKRVQKITKEEMQKRILALEKRILKLTKLRGKKFEEEAVKIIRAAIRDKKTFNAFLNYIAKEGKTRLAEELQKLAFAVNHSKVLRIEDAAVDAEIVSLRRRFGKKWLKEILQKCKKYKNPELRKAYFLDILLRGGPAKYTAKMLELHFSGYEEIAKFMKEVYEEQMRKRYNEALEALEEALKGGQHAA